MQVFSHREPALLITGQAVSGFGDGVATVAYTLLVLDTTHSASKLAWFAAARMTPLVLFLLVGGVIVDRASRRLLLLISDLMRAVLTGSTAVLLALGVLHFWELMAFGVLFGMFDAVFMPAMTALTPEIVPEDLLPAMNAIRPLSGNLVAGMIGPAVGGVLSAWSTTSAITVDCATFLFSAGALTLMHRTPAPARKEGASVVSEIRDGVHYVAHTRWIWATLATVTFMNALVLVPMGVLIPFFLRHDLHTSKATVGYAFAVFGLSGAIGALVAGSVKLPRRRLRLMFTFWTIGTLAALIIGVATNVWEVMAFPLIASPMMVLGNVIWESMLQSEVPRDLLGRVSSVDWFASLGLSPLGLILAGSLSAAIGVRKYYVFASLVTCLPGLVALSSKKINEVDRSRVSRSAIEGPVRATDP